jgi:phosphomannomutase
MSESKSELDGGSFLDHEPVPLAFGTSGLRGLVGDITDLEAYINVKGSLRYLLAIGDIAANSRVVIAGDLRPSTDRILRAALQAIADVDCQAENAGKLPTPALLNYALSTGRAGVMVTGSHIPFDRNGIKINKSSGELLKSDEPGILKEVARVRAEEYARTALQSQFDSSAMFKSAPSLPMLETSAETAYVQRYLRSFGHAGLRGWRVLVYQHSAVGRDILPHILRELGADVVCAGRSETFVALDTENVSDEQLSRLEELALHAESEGPPLHAVVSTDGDSDRPLVAAVLSKEEAGPGGRRVRFLPGDLLGIVTAEYLAVNVAAVPISANDAVERRMRERGITLQTTQIGSPYVIAAIDDLRRAGARGRIVGWEANGGFLTGSEIALEDGTLPALPTRDAVLPILANLYAAAKRGASLAALWSELPARFGRSGLLDGVPTAVSGAILTGLIPAGAWVDVEFADARRVLGRARQASSATALAELDAAAWQALRSTLTRVFTPELHFDEIVRINILDGMRVYFRNGDVAHVRPSGNAPQLRIYANSDSQARADQIVALGLREPDGILRQLIRLTSAEPG